VAGNAQEGLNTVERTPPDCEALLHGPSTLSPVVAEAKLRYIARRLN
jgi:hypothetical protein